MFNSIGVVDLHWDFGEFWPWCVNAWAFYPFWVFSADWRDHGVSWELTGVPVAEWSVGDMSNSRI